MRTQDSKGGVRKVLSLSMLFLWVIVLTFKGKKEPILLGEHRFFKSDQLDRTNPLPTSSMLNWIFLPLNGWATSNCGDNKCGGFQFKLFFPLTVSQCLLHFFRQPTGIHIPFVKLNKLIREVFMNAYLSLWGY